MQTTPLAFEYTPAPPESYFFGFDVIASDRRHECGGSEAVMDSIGDLLRAGLAMIAGAWQADVRFELEPGAYLIRFEAVCINDTPPGGPPQPDWCAEWGCRVTGRELDRHTGEELEQDFAEVAPSAMQVARALLAMAEPHYAGREASPALIALRAGIEALEPGG